MRSHSRRQFLARLAASAAGAASLPTLLGCTPNTEAVPGGGGSARLTARPHAPSTDVGPGSYQITPDLVNDGVLVVPSGYTSGKPIPIVLGLHGATMLASSQVSLMGPYAQSRGFALLAVGARGITWDVMSSRFSYDVAFIDHALKWAFDQVAVDPARIVVEGFSDGASYSLALALANGDLFTRAIAFSPGFIPNSESPAIGKPKFFESHGVNDTILPIDNASRRIVPSLKSRGYTVQYVEFTGGHQVPADIAAQAADFITA